MERKYQRGIRFFVDTFFRAHLKASSVLWSREKYLEKLSNLYPFFKSHHGPCRRKGLGWSWGQKPLQHSHFPATPCPGVLGFRRKHLPQSLLVSHHRRMFCSFPREWIWNTGLWDYRILQWLEGSERAPLGMGCYAEGWRDLDFSQEEDQELRGGRKDISLNFFLFFSVPSRQEPVPSLCVS